jgi:hypothetical protein
MLQAKGKGDTQLNNIETSRTPLYEVGQGATPSGLAIGPGPTQILGYRQP